MMKILRHLSLMRILLLAAILVLGIQLMFLVAIWRMQKANQSAFLLPLPARVASMVEVVERTPDEDRDELLSALNSSDLEIGIVTDFDEADITHGVRLAVFREALSRYSEAMQGRRIEGLIAQTGYEPSDAQITPFGVSAEQPLRLMVELDNGEWLNIQTPGLLQMRFRSMPVGIFAGFFGFLIAAFAVYVIWQQFHPVRRMAVAARKFTRTGRPHLVEPTGARDVRDLVEAFNDLQTRVARLLENRTLMMSAMSHDVRTYLTRLRLRIEFLDEDQRFHAERTIEEIELLLNDTLAFAEIEGRETDFEDADMSLLLSELKVSGQFPEDKTSWTIADPPVVINGHASRLQRSIVNLVSNALKYGQTAEIELEAVDGVAQVTVMDRGPGIPEADMEKVFSPFFRRDDSRNRNVEGAGLGLAIARTVVERHGGRILLQGRIGGGLVATILLPLKQPY